jgi:hypothetical protein
MYILFILQKYYELEKYPHPLSLSRMERDKG